jgi:hypothetical protein
METHQEHHSVQPAILANTTNKADLLQRARDAIDAGEQRLREAAEGLGLAHELHGASQAEMARAIGKSEAWVSYLLQWRRSGYKGDSPFGPRTKVGRLKHAEDRVASGKFKPRKRRKGSREAQPDAEDAEASAAKRKAEYAEQEANAAIGVISQRKPRSQACAKALAEFKVAVDIWFERMDCDARCEAAAYANAKVEAA